MSEAYATYVGHNDLCHPETCACLEYGVVLNEKLISKHYSLGLAEESAKTINNALKQSKE